MIASNNGNEHNEHLKILCQRLESVGIVINVEISEFGRSSIESSRYSVSKDGIQLTDKEIQGILEYSNPIDPNGLRRFLGMVNFHRKSIPNCAQIHSSLNDFLKGTTRKNEKFNWTSL